MCRSTIAEQAVRAIMAAQLSRAQRLARADDVLHNDGGIDDLRIQVAALHKRYIDLSGARRRSDRDNGPEANIGK